MSVKSEKSSAPRLIVVSAPSGAGKTTLCEMLIKEFPAIRLSISTTTRAKRPYEKDGTHYFFVTKEEFQKRIDRGEFAEWAEVHGNRYGTSKKTIESNTKSGYHVLFDIDVQGAMSLRQQYAKQTLLIFIMPPSIQELEARLVGRKGDNRGSIETRLQNASEELEWKKHFDYRILNDDLTRAYEELRSIIKQECS